MMFKIGDRVKRKEVTDYWKHKCSLSKDVDPYGVYTITKLTPYYNRGKIEGYHVMTKETKYFVMIGSNLLKVSNLTMDEIFNDV